MHLAADDDRAGSFIDDDTSRLIGFDHDFADLGEKARGREAVGPAERDALEILGLRYFHAVPMLREGIDRVLDSDSGGEVRVPQFQLERHTFDRSSRRIHLDNGSIRNTASGRYAGGDGFGGSLGQISRDRDLSLRGGVDRLIGARKRCHDKRAAGERLCVAQRRHHDVKARALRREGRQLRRDHDRGDVSRSRLVYRAADIDAHPVEHRLDRLLRKWRVAQRIARAIEPDDKTVADELVDADSSDVGYVLDAGFRPGSGARSKQKKQQGGAKLHCSSTARVRSGCTRALMMMPVEGLRTEIISPTAPDCSGMPTPTIDTYGES